MSLADDASRARLQRGEQLNGIDTECDRRCDSLPAMEETKLPAPERWERSVVFPGNKQ